MTKRNFILLIIVLVVILMGLLGYFYLTRNNVPTPDGGGINFISEFNPFAKTSPTTPGGDTSNGENNPGDTNTPDTGAELQNLTKVSSMPVAGFAVYQKERFKEVPVIIPQQTEGVPAQPEVKPTTKPTPPPTEIVPALRYVSRSNGNIFETFADKVEERQFSTTIIPRIYEAFFGSKAESVIMRYLKADEVTINTFTGTLPKEVLGGDTTNNNEVKGSFLPENITDMSISPDGSKIFYLLGVGDGVVGVTAGTLGTTKIQIFDSKYTEWLSQWPNAKLITLTTKPSYAVPGYMYAVNPDKKDFIKIIGNINGLTTLTSPDGKKVLYSDSNLSLNIYNTESGETLTLPTRTLPEKCVWNSTNTSVFCSVPKFITGAAYPDAWYQGEISFSDDIWKLDVATGSGTLLVDPTEVVGGENIDGTKLTLDSGENYLVFVNKKDSHLWELKLK
ncbi:MAG: hypothetical protein KBC06_00990 [Candidatus Pacebacteria bacterium]|nr:hypothetical protein [Candidatus Paceibacterota bacterium]